MTDFSILRAVSAACAIAASTSAAVITVDDDGAADFASVQGAIDFATEGDEVVVMPGVYFENLDTLGKAITLRSTDPLDDAIVESTILDGNQSGSVIRCVTDEGPDTLISGLTIRNGSGSEFPFSEGYYGGGLHCLDAYPTIERCLITANTAIGGAGLLVLPPYAPDGPREMTIRDCRFVRNRAFIEGFEDKRPMSVGGGALLGFAAFTIERCVFIDNAADDGGGLAISPSSPSVITGCEFSSNTAYFQGGAMSSYSNVDGITAASDCVFAGNFAVARGGAVHHSAYDSCDYTKCLFERNETLGNGGATSGRASDVSFDRCEFYENLAGNNGGAVHHADQANHTYDLCEFRRNGALNDGGAAFHDESDPIFDGCVIAENSAARHGGGMACELSRAELYSCTIAGNTAGGRGGGIDQQIAAPIIEFCIVWGNAPTDIEWFFIEPFVAISILPVETGDGIFNIHEDPRFVDPSNGDFRLGFGSPAIDSDFGGAEKGELDISGNPRFLGFSLDIGAYEFAGSPDCPADCSFDRDVDFGDLAELLFLFGPFTGEACDPDGSGTVDFADLVAALFLFGPCP